MVGGETLPLVVSDNSGSSSSVLLNGPNASWLVSVHIVKEVNSKDSVVLQQSLLFVWALNVSEMRVLFQVECRFAAKSSESVVTSDLVSLCQFHGALRHDVAIVFDCQYCVVKSVKLGQVLGDKVLHGVLLLTGCKRIDSFSFFFDSFRFLFSLCIGVHIRLNFDQDSGGVTSEETLKTVILIFVLVVLGGEGLENEVSRGGPVEHLLGELVLVRVGDSHGDKVISVLSNDLAPEQ